MDKELLEDHVYTVPTKGLYAVYENGVLRYEKRDLPTLEELEVHSD